MRKDDVLNTGPPESAHPSTVFRGGQFDKSPTFPPGESISPHFNNFRLTRLNHSLKRYEIFLKRYEIFLKRSIPEFEAFTDYLKRC